MKNFILTAVAFIAMLLICAETSAQSPSNVTITGRVVDSESGEPVAYATVTVADSLMSPVNAAAADMTGRFSLRVKEAGDFKLIVTYVGYAQYMTDISIAPDEKKLELGEIALMAGEEIEEVSVVIKKPLIKVDPDKMTYSVEADPESEYSSLAEILRKVPQLSVDSEENVLLNGQSDYKVLVNGKSSGMMSRNFKEVIRSMPANSVKDIEVITNPSTKYEAEGAGGIINIITHRGSTMTGYTGSVGVGYSSLGDYSANAYISAQVGKFTFSTNIWAGTYNIPEYTSKQEGYVYMNGVRNNLLATSKSNNGQQRNISGSLEASYEIDTFNLITMAVWAYDGSYRMNSLNETHYWDDAGATLSRYTNNSYMKNGYGSLSGSLDYQRTFAKPDKLFTLSYKLETNPHSSEADYDVDGLVNYPSSRELRANESNGTEHTVQADYYNPLTTKHHIEFGVKYILRRNVSDTEEYLWNGGWQPHNAGMYELDYDQHIYGIYGGYLFKHDKLTAKAGFRMEGTHNAVEGTAQTGPFRFKTDNFNVVPYVNLSYMLKPSQTVRLSYTQRLRRPSIWNLNPYVEESENQTFVSYGNPQLKSAISHSFSANYSIFSGSSSIFLGADYSLSNNNITSLQFEDSSNPGKIASSYFNIGRQRSLGLNASYNYRLGTRLSLYTSVGARYTWLSADLSGLDFIPTSGQSISNEGLSYNGNMGVNVTLWKDASFSLNGGLFSSGLELQRKSSLYYYVGTGLTQRFLKQRLSVSLSVSDPFTKFRTYKQHFYQEGFMDANFESRQQSRRIQLRASYRFGKMNVQVKKARRTITNDDQVGGGGSSAGAPQVGGQ